jgi:hypothetical protein
MPESKRIIIPREVLLIEIDRRCCFSDCKARVLIGLTKHEAKGYRGFTCVPCNRWNVDTLTEKDVSDWWDEIKQHQVSIH